MASTPPPIPLHSKPTRSTAPSLGDKHSCVVCKDLDRFPYQPDRCPFTGGDISYKLSSRQQQRLLEEDYGDVASDVPVRVEGMIYCSFDTAKVIARWLLYCTFENCPGFDERKS